MFLPQFSLRRVLWVITAWACFFLVVGQALRGQAWALGVTVAVLSLLAAAFSYAIFFVLVTFAGQMLGTESVRARTSRGSVVSGTDPEGPRSGNKP